ncbi:hypothetical protein BU23DRAFT_81315 [Bimuria novae-zelandiae CBS 107.79]|uniref:Something about silencing protein 4 domain-containing protein n=1 Tax=Bimuria novae-zelandiae CBS 107.79 TaxID=1447943 RepID=A0A6A5VDP9_9PLEO|nr:hypothetical protein BU23DRAFT_81315 [Bimuria novae-zelandiae CBS 107.79]
MLKAMANFIRPATDRRSTRHARSRSPPPAEVARTAAQRQQQPPAPVVTRRVSKNLPLPWQEVQQPNAAAATPPNQPSPARASTRKRSIAEMDTPDAGPPSKIKQRRSHEGLAAPTNGTTKKHLVTHVDDVQSRASTPKPVDAAQTTSAMVDKKNLRSADPVRKVSQLAEIFDDYRTTITNWEEGENAECSISSDDSIAVVDEPLTNAQLEELRTAAAEARATRQLPDSSHSYTRRHPLDYTPYANALPTTDDPLADGLYTKVHKKYEKSERMSRNDELRSFQYKMSKAPSVLDELESDDWHKVFAIDKSERDQWESKRNYYIKELQVAIRKQEALRKVELEKRRTEKEREKREKETPASDEDEDEEDEPKPKRPRKNNDPARPSSRPKTPEPPKPRRPPRPHGFVLDWVLEKKDKFRSFYEKGQRPASLSGRTSSRATRSADAPPFGVPLPDMFTRLEDADLPQWLKNDNEFAKKGEPTEEDLALDEQRFKRFRLTDAIVTREMLLENERERRRRKRESAAKRREAK